MKIPAPLRAFLAFGVGAVSVAAAPNLEVYLTAKDTSLRLSRIETRGLRETSEIEEHHPCIFVDATKTFQTIIGIGGALTDAAAETLYKLPPEKQEEVMRAYYDPVQGIGYSLGRTPINSCDFSSESYTYVKENDEKLGTFSIGHDLEYRIPMIKRALAIANGKLALFISPWSPPAWMKTNHDMLHGGKLKPEFREAWARYYVAFIKAYEGQGIPIWGLTVQNEPMAAQKWESCVYTAEEERDFVKEYLGPVLEKSGLGSKKIIIWDHNRTLMYQRAEVALDDADAAKYIWGVGFHWYANDSFDNVRRVKEAFPNTHLLFTEGCNYPFDLAKLDEWQWGETYGRSMIMDFNNGAEGWTDWNVLLDEKGGPNHVGNNCYAPVHANTATGRLMYMNSFYYIGHFSKFVRPGARRIVSSSMLDTLLTTAFLNQDGSIAVVVMNTAGKEQPFTLCLGSKAVETKSPAHSIMTVVYVPDDARHV